MWFIIWAGIILLSGVILFILYRRRMRGQMLTIMLNIARNYMHEFNEASREEDVIDTFHRAMDSLRGADRYIKNNHDRERINTLKTDLIGWRDHQLTLYYAKKVKQLFSEAEAEEDTQKKTERYLDIRNFIMDGTQENLHTLLPQINQKIVNLLYSSAISDTGGQQDERNLHIYEQTLWKILNIGIPDQELEQFNEVHQLIRKIEKLEKKLDSIGA